MMEAPKMLKRNYWNNAKKTGQKRMQSALMRGTDEIRGGNNICPKLIKKTAGGHQIDINTQLIDVAHVSLFNFEHILLLVLLFLMLTLN